MLVEFGERASQLSLNQRWGNAMVFLIAVMMIVYGINLREEAINRVTIYEDIQAGIKAFYPEKWLLDTNGEYIFRVRDMKASGYNTTIQVVALPASNELNTRNVIDQLALARSAALTDYRVLAVENITLQNQQDAVGMSYTYVAQESSPFLEGLPAVVVGYDVLLLTRGQIIIVTFRADRNNYDAEFERFNRFLDALEY